jgi:hypothetical protein
MLTSILIIAVSVVLLVYWFRYTCLLLIRTAAISSPSSEASNRFSFGDVQSRIRTGEALDPLQVALQKDYDLLVYLLEHAAGLEMQSIEDRLLVWDYKVMCAFYRVTRSAAPQQARRALTEMADVIGILAGKLGQRAGVQTHA